MIVPENYLYCDVNKRITNCRYYYKNIKGVYNCKKYNWCIFEKFSGTICIAEKKKTNCQLSLPEYENLWNKIKKYNQRIEKLKRIINS